MKIRKGKNIFFRLAVTMADGEPENFSNAYGLRISITEKFSGVVYLPSVRIEENVLLFEFPGTENRCAGDYNLSLTYKKVNYGSTTGYEPFFLDIPSVFQAVDLTSQEDLKHVVNNLESASVTIKGDVNAPRNGIDGTIPHIGENGNWFLRDEDTGKPSRGEAFTYADFTAEEIEGLWRPATEAAQSAKDAVAMLSGIVTEQNWKIASLEELVTLSFNPLSTKHYSRVVADGGTIFASYRELSDWFDREGITETDMDGTGEVQLIRIDPYYTGVKIDPSSTSVRYINKAYNVCEKWDMQAIEAVELTEDHWFRCVKEKANQGLRTAKLGMFFRGVVFSCKYIAEEVVVRQCPNGTDWEDRVGVAGIDAMSICVRYTLLYNNSRVGQIYPGLVFRSQYNLSEFPLRERPYYPDDTEQDCRIGESIKYNSNMVAEINGLSLSQMFLMSDDFWETPVISESGFKIFTSAAALGGNSGQGTVRVKDVKFRFKEYIAPANGPLAEEESK